jgi:flagellar basal body rod protein FlgC
MGQNPYLINFPKRMKMLKIKHIKSATINVNKNKLNIVKSTIKNKISSKLNQKKAFYRSLEAFSDCV